MRVNLKPAAAAAAGAFLLLLLLDLTWPGHGIWLLVVGIMIGLAAAYSWWRDHFLSDQRRQPPTGSSPFSSVGAYGLTGVALQSSRQQTSGVPLAGVLAPVSTLAILLFVGGALGSGEGAIEQTSARLDQEVAVIDRSGDGQPTTPQVNPPTASQVQRTSTPTAVAAVTPTQDADANPQSSAPQQQSAAPVKPIVVSAPKAASAAEDEETDASLVPESANTFEYVVEEGDTLYDIAERYNSTVDAIMNLNRLDASSFIHPGDVLLIPVQEEETGAEES